MNIYPWAKCIECSINATIYCLTILCMYVKYNSIFYSFQLLEIVQLGSVFKSSVYFSCSCVVQILGVDIAGSDLTKISFLSIFEGVFNDADQSISLLAHQLASKTLTTDRAIGSWEVLLIGPTEGPSTYLSILDSVRRTIKLNNGLSSNIR